MQIRLGERGSRIAEICTLVVASGSKKTLVIHSMTAGAKEIAGGYEDESIQSAGW